MSSKTRFKKQKSEISWIQVLILSIVSCILIIFFHNAFKFEISNFTSMEVAKAKITELGTSTDNEIMGGYFNTTVTFYADIKSGEHKGDNVLVTQNIDAYVPSTKNLGVGTNIVIINMAGDESPSWQFSSLFRTDYLILLVLIFFAFIILIGRSKGITTVLSLIFTFASIFFVFIPAILSGVNIYLITSLITIYIILVSLCLINGFNKKTLCAIIGNLGGIVLSGLFAIAINHVLNITGILSVDYISLFLLETVKLDLKGIIWSGILIGSLGAVMDVSMTISSAMNEIAKEMEVHSFAKLFTAGMNIGKDAIGTMTNTLILAYVGSSLATILLYFTSNSNLLYLMNMEMIVVEVVQAIVGSMGILLCVPITVAFSAWIFGEKKDNKIDAEI